MVNRSDTDAEAERADTAPPGSRDPEYRIPAAGAAPVPASTSRKGPSPWPWLPLVLVLSSSISVALFDTGSFDIDFSLFLPVLFGWLGGRMGGRAAPLLGIVWLLSVASFQLELGYVATVIGPPVWLSLLSTFCLVSFAGSAEWNLNRLVIPERWRIARWLVPVVLVVSLPYTSRFAREVGNSAEISMNVGLVLLALLLAACFRWRSVGELVRSNGRLQTVMTAALIGVIMLALLLFGFWETGDFGRMTIVTFGYSTGHSFVYAFVIVLVVARAIDWRLLVASLLVFSGFDIVADFAIDTWHAYFPAEATDTALSGGALELPPITVEGARITRYSHQLPLLAHSCSLLLLAVLLRPFWSSRGAAEMRPARTVLFLLPTILLLEFAASLGWFSMTGIEGVILGAVAFVAGRTWRFRGLIAGPVIIMLCDLIRIIAVQPDYFGPPATLALANLGLVAFPFAFFGLLSARYAVHPSGYEAEGRAALAVT